MVTEYYVACLDNYICLGLDNSLKVNDRENNQSSMGTIHPSHTSIWWKIMRIHFGLKPWFDKRRLKFKSCVFQLCVAKVMVQSMVGGHMSPECLPSSICECPLLTYKIHWNYFIFHGFQPIIYHFGVKINRVYALFSPLLCKRTVCISCEVLHLAAVHHRYQGLEAGRQVPCVHVAHGSLEAAASNHGTFCAFLKPKFQCSNVLHCLS